MRNRHVLTASAVAATAALALTACGTTSGGGDGDYVSGGTFVKALTGDPGNLNPFNAVSFDTIELMTAGYESLIYVDAEGTQNPWLAESWEETGTEVSFTLKDGITCHDGSDFTAETAANNINYHADPANATLLHGSQVTEAMSASADGNVLTVTSEVNDPFLVQNIGTVLMVCQAVMDDVTSVDDTVNGTGLFAPAEFTAGSSYLFTKRDDYTWGPFDVTSDTVGLPDELEYRIVDDESTRANLLLSGEINAAGVIGPDAARLDAAGLEFQGVRNSVGEMLFNERADRPTSDPLVREALVTALDRDEVGAVIADGKGIPAVSLVTKPPLICVEETPRWTLVDTDLERAGELLDEAGWTVGPDGVRVNEAGEPLTIKFIYDAPTATHGPAAELVAETWKEIGIETELSANDAAAWSEQLFSTFDWDTGWVQIAPNSPVQNAIFYDAAGPDEGGLNFMFVENPEYEALAAQAREAGPDEACDLWNEAEAELINRFDVFPLIDNIIPLYGTGADFDAPNYILPTSIRMLG